MNNFIDSNLMLVALVTVLAVISPGPDFAVIVRNGLRYGRKPGLATAAGIGSGVVVHTTYILLGLGYVVNTYSWVLEVIRYAGAAYLIWLGISSLMSSGKLMSGALKMRGLKLFPLSQHLETASYAMF